MAWPLAWVIVAGTVPGIIIGYYIRIKILPDPKSFKFFVGIVLLYIGIRLFLDVFKKKKTAQAKKFDQKLTKEATVRTISFSLRKNRIRILGREIFFQHSWSFHISLYNRYYWRNLRHWRWSHDVTFLGNFF